MLGGMFRFVYSVAAGLFGMLRAHFADKVAKEAEIVVLRQQLEVLRRQDELKGARTRSRL